MFAGHVLQSKKMLVSKQILNSFRVSSQKLLAKDERQVGHLLDLGDRFSILIRPTSSLTYGTFFVFPELKK